MARTDEAESFFHAVYSAIQEIPYGKVTSYGHIARLVGTRTSMCYQSDQKGNNWLNHYDQLKDLVK
jgi:hypothetical protein